MVAKTKVVAKVAKVAKESTHVKKGRVAKALVKNVAKAVIAKAKTIVTKVSESESFRDTEIEPRIDSVLDGCWIGLKRNKKVKVATYSETNFDCPNPECKAVLISYRTMFDHFAGASC